MMKTLCLAALSPFMLAAASAPEVETKNDVRCLVALSSLVGSQDTKVAMAGLIGSQYYLGRIDGRAPNLDLASAIIGEARTLNESEIAGLLRSCGKLLEHRGKAVTAIGQQVDQEEAKSSASAS